MTSPRNMTLIICTLVLFSGIPSFAANPFGEDASTQAGKMKTPVKTQPAPAKAKVDTRAKADPKGPQIPEHVAISDIIIAFQETDMAIVNYREYEELNSRKNAGFLAAAGFTAAGVNLDKKRNFLDRLIAAAKPEDLPELPEIRKAYQAFTPALKGYLAGAAIGGILSGPNARATTASYLVLVAASAKFKNSLKQIQRAAVTKSAEQNSALKQAEQAEKEAYEKLQSLIKQGADGEAIKTAAKNYDDAKKTLDILKGN